MDAERIVHASRVLHAPAATIFELIADPSRQPGWDGDDDHDHAEPGQRVRAVDDVLLMTSTGGDVRANRIVAFEEGRTIAWRPGAPGEPEPGHEWRWDLDDLGDGTTRVTHTYDWTRLTDERRLDRARSTSAASLAASIDRLADLAESIADADAAAREHAVEDGAPPTSAPAQRIAVVVPAHDVDALDVLVPELLGTADGAELDLAVIVVPSAAEVSAAAGAHAIDDARVQVASVALGVEGAEAFAAALRSAAAVADVVAVVGGHGRNDPAELPALLARLEERDVDVVVGEGLATAAAPGFAAMHADVVAPIADRVGAGIARIGVVAASLGLAVASVDVDDRDAGSLGDVVDGWHAWHDRLVLGALDRRVLRTAVACGLAAVAVALLVAILLVVPAIIGLAVLPGMLAATGLGVAGAVVAIVALALDASRVAARETRPPRS